MSDVIRWAEFSDDHKYRWMLRRWWGNDLISKRGGALFIMLNASTADQHKDDPTVRRCVGFARSWGLPGVTICNLYAFRSMDPKKMFSDPDPIGPRNDEFIRDAVKRAAVIVAAWGAWDTAQRAADVEMIVKRRGKNLQCLGFCKNGNPRHPLYVRADAKLFPFFGKGVSACLS